MSGTDHHWQAVYQANADTQTSWFRPHLDESLRLIDGLELTPATPVIDVGGGRATLIDDLLARGFNDTTVLDVSEAALAAARQRLGAAGNRVHWQVADITRAELPRARYGLWHDRAVFHFLTKADERARYIAAAARSIRSDGFAILGTFAPDGPEKCSGLSVCRYDAERLALLFAPNFDRVSESREIHTTPFGTSQAFTYVVLRRTGDNT